MSIVCDPLFAFECVGDISSIAVAPCTKALLHKRALVHGATAIDDILVLPPLKPSNRICLDDVGVMAFVAESLLS